MKKISVLIVLAGLGMTVAFLSQRAQHFMPQETPKSLLHDLGIAAWKLPFPFSGPGNMNRALLRAIQERVIVPEPARMEGVEKSSKLRGCISASRADKYKVLAEYPKTEASRESVDVQVKMPLETIHSAHFENSRKRILNSAEGINGQPESINDEPVQKMPSTSGFRDTILVSLINIRETSIVSLNPRTMLSDTGVQIDIPAEVGIKDISVRSLREAPADSEDLVGIGSAMEFNPSGALFRTPLRISFPYSLQELQAAGIGDPEILRVMVFDPARNTWTEEGIRVVSVDRTKNQVVAEVTHFSIFRLFGPKKKQPPPSKKQPPPLKQGNLLDFLQVALGELPAGVPSLLGQHRSMDGTLSKVATTQGNALALLALAGLGQKQYQAAMIRLADSMLFLQSQDPAKDGRLRNAYDLNGLLQGRSMGEAILDSNSSPRDLALALLSLVQVSKITSEPKYQQAAEKLGHFLQWFLDTKDPGYFAVLWEDPKTNADRPAKRTVDNLLLYAAFLRLYEITLERKWWDAAFSAKTFAESQGNGEFFMGGQPGATDDPTTWLRLVEDPNPWSVLVYGKEPRLLGLIQWCKNNLEIQALGGLGLDSNLDRDGISAEATLRYVLTSLILGQNPPNYLADLRSYQGPLKIGEDLFPLDGPAAGMTVDTNKFIRAQEDLSCAIWLFASINRWNLLWGQPIEEKVPTEKTIAAYVRIEEPSPNQIFPTPVITVSGKALPMDLAVSVNGFGARREGEDFFLDQFVLTAKGDNTIAALVRAKDGRDVVDQRTVQFQPAPPSAVKIRIQEGSLTNKGMVGLLLEAQGAMEMRVEEDLKKASWEPYQSSKIYLLSRGDGVKTVFAQFRNEFLEESPVVSASIILDSQPPVNAMFQIEEGDYTIARTIHLLLKTEETASFMAIHDGRSTGWLPVQERFALDLSPQEGKKILTVQFKDQAGNQTQPQSQEIWLFVEKPAQLPKVRWISILPNPLSPGQSLEVRAWVSSPLISNSPVKKALCILFSADERTVELPMQAVDGKFNSVQEEVKVSIPADVLAKGDYRKVGVQGSDVFGQWGPVATAVLNPTPAQVLERVGDNYARLNDLKARLETTIQFPDGGQESSTRQFLIKRPDKMKTVSANGQEISILRGSILTTKGPDIETGSVDISEGSGVPFTSTNWVFNLPEFFNHHQMHFKKDTSGGKGTQSDTFVLEAIPKEPSKVNYDSIVFVVNYAKGIETEVSYHLGDKILSRLTHDKIEWVGDVAWFGTSDVKAMPIEGMSDLRTIERFQDVQVNTNIPDQEFEP